MGHHLLRGLTAGAVFALVENLFAIFTGSNVPLATLGLTLGVDLLAGALAGLAAALVLPRSSSTRLAFFFLAAAATLLFESERLLAAVRQRGLLPVLAVVGVGLLLGGALTLRLKILKSLDAPGRAELALGLGLLVFAAVAVTSHFLVPRVGARLLSASSLALNAGLALLALLALRIVTGLSARIPPRGAAWSPAGVTRLALGLSVGLSLLAWATRLPREAVMSRPNPFPVRARGPSIILVCLDTLRADHVSSYGYFRPTTPRLDAFARGAVLYRNAFSPAAWTLPAHVSMFSGESSRRHGAELDAFGPKPIHADTVLLSELLRRAGYRTAAIVANPVLRPPLGFERGFDMFDARFRRLFGYRPAAQELLGWLLPLEHDRLVKPARGAEEILEDALVWIDGTKGAPFFLFLNLMDPHAPWTPPRAYQDLFPGRSVRAAPPVPETLNRMVRGEEKVDERVRENALALYDAAIAAMDDALGRFLDRLAVRRLADDALVIVTSDHGEFFGEHGRWAHGYGPYDPVYRVPLLVKYPGGSPRGERDDWVDTSRVFPTILDAAAVEAPTGVANQPLARVVHEPIAAQQPLSPSVIGWPFNRPYRVLREDPWKLVAYEDASELYDLRRDAGEQHDLSGEEPGRVEEMRRRLSDWTVSVRPRDEASRDRVVDQEEIRRMRALGYLR